jgi:long-subunit acyl-CoA synthetase (AMP-forming)
MMNGRYVLIYGSSCSQTCPVVSNICIYGEASRSFVVALVCPVPEKLRALADRLPNKADMEFEALCKVDTISQGRQQYFRIRNALIRIRIL